MPDTIQFGPLRSTQEFVREEAARQGVNPDLAAAVAKQESGYRQGAVSPKGAIGVMQLMPSTAKDLGVNPRIEAENVRGGVEYLRELLGRYHGDMAKALAAYNAGMGRVDSGRPLPQETRQYVAAITGKTGAQPGLQGGIEFGPLRDIGAEGEPAEPRRSPLAKEEKPGFFTRSLIETTTGKSATDLLPTLQTFLPKSMRGQYAVDLADEVSKAGPEMVDFLTSPMGLGLVTAHLFPATAPFAAAADVVLGGKMALQSIPSVIDAAGNIRDPRKVGRAIVDLFGAYAGLKGGSRLAGAMRKVPAEVRAGKPLVRAVANAYRDTAPPPQMPRGADLRARLEAAAPEGRAAIIAELEQPTSLLGKVEQKLYRTPVVRGFVNVLAPRLKKPALGELGQSMVDDYAGFINKEENRARRVADKIRRTVPEEDQNIRRLGYAMEGDLPEAELSPQAREVLREMRELNRERDTMLREAYGDDIGLRDPETYIRHYWDFSDPASPAAKYGIATRMMKDQALRERTAGNLKRGIEGFVDDDGNFIQLRPKYENVADVVYRRHVEGARTIANQRFANTLRDFGLIVDPTRANMRSLGWNQAREAPALMRAVYSGETPRGDTIMRPKAPLVHPDIEMAVKAIFDEPARGLTYNIANQLRSFSKQLAVGFSLFHHNALSEVSQAEALAGGGAGAAGRFAKALAWPLDPEFQRGVRNSIWEIRGKVAPEAPPDVRLRREVVEPWLADNLSMKSAESEAAAIRAAMDLWKDKGPLFKTLGLPIRALGKTQYVFNRALFDYYLPGQMLHTAEALLARESGRLGPHATPAQVSGLRREIADHVNRAYGADNLQRLLLTPKAQQALAFTFFAPLWTLSNLRVLAKGYETTTGARITNRYVAGAALTYFLTAELANYAISDWYAKHSPTGGEYWDEESKGWKRGGHWTWQNPGAPVKVGGKYVPGLTDNAANIYFGQNPDGSARYIRLGKAYREPFLWMTHTLETLGSKLSLPLRQAIVQLTKHDPGTGFPAIDSEKSDEQQNKQRVGEFIEMFAPFSGREWTQRALRAWDSKVFPEPGTTSQWFGLPARKGASVYGSVADLREALESDRLDLAIQIARNAQLNKIDPQRLIRELSKRKWKEARTAFGLPKTGRPPVAEEGTPSTSAIEFGPLRPPEE